jgi:glycerophosphoryl diester phosphodiesterase
MNLKWQIYALVVLGLLLFYVPVCFSQAQKSLAPIFIAHAGGAVKDKTYTNSLEALETNYEKGFRFFEVDFSWTSDREVVAIHDWDQSFLEMFFVQENVKIPSKVQFLRFKTKSGLTQLSLEDVLKWAQKKGDVFVVTDVKEDNLKVLEKIPAEYRSKIIPQAYTYQEYGKIVQMGYKKVILTLYRMKVDHDTVLRFSKNNSPFAITMHWSVVQQGLANLLQRNNTKVYAHTINDINNLVSLSKMGVFGIYTDYIVPP